MIVQFSIRPIYIEHIVLVSEVGRIEIFQAAEAPSLLPLASRALHFRALGGKSREPPDFPSDFFPGFYSRVNVKKFGISEPLHNCLRETVGFFFGNV